MSAFRLMVLALTGLMALPLAGSALQQSDYVDLNKSRLIIVKIPAGTFRMGSDLVIHADDGWKPCSTCSPRNEVEQGLLDGSVRRHSEAVAGRDGQQSILQRGSWS